MRLNNEDLEKIKQKYNTDRLWSWSRVNTFITSPYEYMLKYVLHKPEDRCDSCYNVLGTICHDTLDSFYEGKIKYEDMIDNYNDGFLTNITVLGLKFDRNNEEKNSSIGNRYNENLIHFFKNHTVYKHKLSIEKPVVINVNDNIFVGYIDAMYTDDDGNYHIIDFKSSSIYTGKTLEEHSGQLVLYAYGLSQMKNIPLEKININFNFLKYCTIEYEQANGKVKTRNVERSKIGESLQSNAKVWLKKFGYEDELDEYLKLLLDTNTIECLPKEVQDKYKITDCYVYIDLTDKLLNKWIDTITTTIKDIELREKDYKETHNDKVFWDTDESIEKQNYYFATLCGYSRKLHKPFDEFLNKLEAKKNGSDLYSNVGSDVSSITSDVVCSNSSNSNSSSNNEPKIDLSWLDNI